ncbi:MAG: DUF5685 family protein [Christensenellaceae bacterium]|jgi:hypothetical protein|nr:DUF5685 family protein [Christensenellaceae bacterium]
MFGYVNVDKPNMLIKDFTEYKAYYCGLCKTLGRRYSQLTRITVNFDITFLTILAHNYRNIPATFDNDRCVIHPVGKKFVIANNDPVQEIVADLNIILGYHKALDDVLDGGNIKYKAVKYYLKRKFLNASKKFPEVAKSVETHYENLRNLEKNKETSLEKLADPFAKLLMDVCIAAAGRTDENLENLSYNLGKWIYVIDAYDDLLDDLESNKFNPLNPAGQPIDETKSQSIYEITRDTLFNAISCIREAYDGMNITISEGPLSNIIYCGLYSKSNAVLNNRGGKGKRTLL